MHLFINSLAASAGGGLTYIRNVLPHLAARPDLRVTVVIESLPQRRISRPKQRRLSGVGSLSCASFLVRTVGAPRSDPAFQCRCSALHWKLRSEKITGTANPAVAQFDLHFRGLLSRLAFAPRVRCLARYPGEGRDCQEVDKVGRCHGCAERSICGRTALVDGRARPSHSSWI